MEGWACSGRGISVIMIHHLPQGGSIFHCEIRTPGSIFHCGKLTPGTYFHRVNSQYDTGTVYKYRSRHVVHPAFSIQIYTLAKPRHRGTLMGSLCGRHIQWFLS